MELEITLSRGEMVLKAKDETYLAVRSYLVTQQANQNARYEMQADERDTHERKLLSSIASSVARFKSVLHRYEISDTLTDGQDEFQLTLSVSSRFRKNREEDVKRLMQQYIYRNMVAEWWEANYPDAAGQYTQSALECMMRLQMLLSLCYPQVTHLRSVEKTEDKKGYHLLVTLYPEEIMDDVHSEILSVSEARRNEQGIPDIAMQTDELYGVEPLTRSIRQSALGITECLSAYLDDVTEEQTEKEAAEEWEAETVNTVLYSLTMPPSWKNILLKSMPDEMHAFIVDKAVARYLYPYAPELSAYYDTRGDAARDNLKYILTMRKPGYSKRPYQPF